MAVSPGTSTSSSLRLPTLAATLVALLCLSATAPAQFDPSLNIVQQGRLDLANNYADIWGEGDFAFVSHNLQGRVTIADISDPTNPTLAAIYDVPSPDSGASAQDVKVHNGLMYIGLEGSGTAACIIVDVRDPTNPVRLTRISVGNKYSGTHNVFYDVDSEFLYLANSSTNSVGVVDLRGYNPDNPPSTINSLFRDITGVGGLFVHDITVLDGRLYASAWDSLQVYDISNMATQSPVLLGSAPGPNVHAAWPTDDGRYVVTAEEAAFGALRLFEIKEYGSSIGLVALDSFALPASASVSAHNPVMRGDFVYLSHYQAGVSVLGIDRRTNSFRKVGSYDTSNQSTGGFGFAGCWGVYPLLGSDRVLASDIQRGIFVLKADMMIPSLDEIPVSAFAGSTTTVQLDIAVEGAALVPSTVELLTTLDGGPQVITTMTDLGGGSFSVDLPTDVCGELSWHVRAKNSLGANFRNPAGSFHQTVIVSGLTSVLNDDFETDQGWTNDSGPNLIAGDWVRGNPNGTNAQPEDDNPNGIGTQCLFTGQGSVGGSDGQADVDDGPATIISPSLDFSAGDGQISFAYWAYNDDATDFLEVRVSDDNTNWEQVDIYIGESGGWNDAVFRVSDYVTPGPNIWVSFRTGDTPNDSITECAVDDVVASVFECNPSQWADLGGGSAGSNGVPALAVDGSLVPGTTLAIDLLNAPPSALLLFWLSVSSTPVSVAGGTLYANPKVFSLLLAADPTGELHTAPIWGPGSGSGVDLFLQFLIQDGSVSGGFTLSNAVTATTP
jgi:choice-of-anchor B domain-containing protein